MSHTESDPTDADLVQWVQGLISALELSGVTRAQGDEWIDPAYLVALTKRLGAESVSDEHKVSGEQE